MKQGRSLQELAAELDRRSKAKHDLVASTESLSMPASDTDTIILAKEDMEIGNSQFNINNLAHSQIAAHAGIPQKYYDRMRQEVPDLLAANVNRWMREKPARRMLRTMDGQLRAFLSDRYRRLDNEDVAEAALSALGRIGDSELASCDVTDKRLYIKALFPSSEKAVKVGDPVQAGVVISNSEVGLGALNVQLLVYRLVCLNGMIAGTSLRQHHVGGRIVEDGIVYRDATVEANDRALMMRLEDTIAAIPGQPFDEALEDMRNASSTRQLKSPSKAVEVLSKSYDIRSEEREGILERLIRGGDYTMYGMANAVTNLANTTEDYDRATELEAAGGQIIKQDERWWNQIAEAA